MQDVAPNRAKSPSEDVPTRTFLDNLAARTASAKTYSSGATLLQEVEFTYDIFDRRIAKTVDADGAGAGSAVTVYTAYDGEHAWADFDGSSSVLARHLFGDRTDEIIARWQPTESTAWYLTDHLGTVRDLVDDSGDLINTITYDSFGNILSQTDSSAVDRFTYTGREYDAELDLYYYRARYYDPHLGRFVSQDPIGFSAGDANLYRYVGNRVTRFVDPSGLQVENVPFYGRIVALKMEGQAAALYDTDPTAAARLQAGADRIWDLADEASTYTDAKSQNSFKDMIDYYRDSAYDNPGGGGEAVQCTDPPPSPPSPHPPSPRSPTARSSPAGRSSSASWWNPIDLGLRWIYTGHAFSPDDDYAAALDAAGGSYNENKGTAHAALDAVSVVDPIGVSDGLNGTLYALEGDRDAAIESYKGMVLGEIGKRLERAKNGQRTLGMLDDVGEQGPRQAVLGRKLDYLFGKATGRAHNIERSTDMLRQMQRIGLPDTAANRQLLTKHFQDVLNDASNIAGKGAGGTTIRESLLMGPNGGVKIKSFWDGDTLRTFILEGTGSRFSP